MSDRIFAAITLAIFLIYGIIAFTIIKAPFQYDPLGPESWPRILSVVAILCSLYIMARPDKVSFGVANQTLVRITIVVALLSAYAYFFEIAGFIIATAVFCSLFSRLFGASTKEAILFGLATGICGHLLCVMLLDLNLPEGILAPLL